MLKPVIYETGCVHETVTDEQQCQASLVTLRLSVTGNNFI